VGNQTIADFAVKHRSPFSVLIALVLAFGPATAAAQADEPHNTPLDTLQQQANAGDVGAQVELSDRYNSGRGVAFDGQQAVMWMRKAAEQGNVKAEARLGQMFRSGRTASNYKDAVVWYRKAAQHGDASAQMSLAQMLAAGDGACMDFSEAVSWLRKAAEQGTRNAFLFLGDAYEFGKGVPPDLNEARKWYQKAADLGDSLARAKLALFEAKAAMPPGFQNVPVPPSPEAGTGCIMSNMYLAQLARSGDPAAEAQTARYPNRMDVPTQKRAELGDPHAEEDMGSYYDALKNYDAATAWYTRASRYWLTGGGSADIALVRLAVLRYKPSDPDDLAETSLDASATARNPTSTNDFRTLSAEQVLALLENASNLKVNPDGTRLPPPDRRAAEWFKGCNGTHSSDDTVQADQGENACFQVFTNFGRAALSDPSNLVNMQYIMTALIRGCGIYAPSADKAFEGRTCGLLGAILYGIGNASAAKAVWELASGCYSEDERAGTPMNGCVRAMTGRDANLLDNLNLKPYQDLVRVFKFQPKRLARIMWRSCTTIHDRESCEFLSSNDATVDMSAVVAAENERHEGIQESRERNAAELERSRAESENRRNAFLGALRSMGGSNPNAILNAGNQQAAAIGAIAEANAARQRRDTQLRLTPTQMAPQTNNPAPSVVVVSSSTPPPSAQPVVAPSGAPATASNSGVAPSSSSGSTSSGAVQYLTPLASSCIRQFWDPNTYNWLSFENDCGQQIYVSFIPRQKGGWAMGGAMHLAPGHSNNTGLSSDDLSKAGGMGIYVCPADSLPVDLNGNVLNTNVTEFRCKPQ
jgi:TPR repeat protein